MDDLLNRFGNFLINHGAVEGLGIDLSFDYVPDSPDQLVAIIEEVGGQVVFSAFSRHIKILVRSGQHNPTWSKVKCWEIFNLLNQEERSIDDRGDDPYEDYSNLWGVLDIKSSPYKLKVDQNGRYYYCFTFVFVTQGD